MGLLLGLLDMNLGHGIILGDPRDIMAEGDVVSPADITAAVIALFRTV